MQRRINTSESSERLGVWWFLLCLPAGRTVGLAALQRCCSALEFLREKAVRSLRRLVSCILFQSCNKQDMCWTTRSLSLNVPLLRPNCRMIFFPLALSSRSLHSRGTCDRICNKYYSLAEIIGIESAVFTYRSATRRSLGSTFSCHNCKCLLCILTLRCISCDSFSDHTAFH